MDRMLTVKGDNGEKLNKIDIIDEIKMFFMAGHETTSNSLCWIIYCLGNNPKFIKKIIEEIGSIAKEHNQSPNDYKPIWEDLSKMKYIEQVIKEAMRLFPVVTQTARNVGVDTEVNGYKMKKGATIILNLRAVMRDPKYFEEPETFDPERWSDESNTKASQMPGVYCPFGDGPKNCIGQKLAMIEMKTVLFRFIQKFPQFSITIGQNIIPIATITVGPKDGLFIDLNSPKLI